MHNIKLEWEIDAGLGEGPLWVAEERAVYWLDIVGHKVHRMGVGDGSRKTWQFDFEVTSLARRSRGGFVCTVRDGFAFLDLEKGRFDAIEMPESHLPGNRFNDGKVDAQGRYWAGTMDESEKEATGALYRLDGDLSLHAMDSDYVITNGPAFSPDGRTMYHNDTARRRMYRYEVNTGGNIGKRQVFAAFEDPAGYPDGLAVDENGDIWQASFGGARITRLSPRGDILEVIELPVPNVTSCTFGGAKLDTLYVTTARLMLEPEQLREFPLAGSLFSLKPGVRGLPTPEFAG